MPKGLFVHFHQFITTTVEVRLPASTTDTWEIIIVPIAIDSKLNCADPYENKIGCSRESMYLTKR